MDRIIMSLDPGIAHVGYCFARVVGTKVKPFRVGLFETEGAGKNRVVRKTTEDYGRIIAVMGRLGKLIRKYKPRLLVAEMPVGGARSSAAVKYLAMATAIVAHLETMYRLPLIQVDVHTVKLTWCGDKKADKIDMINKAVKLYGHIKGWPRNKRTGKLAGPLKLEHPADAIATLFAADSDPAWKLIANGMV